MSQRRGRTLALGLVCLAVAASALVAAPAATAAVPPSVERVAGGDRYETAARISAHAFPAARGGTVYIASGAAYPDALSAAPAARKDAAPVLLTAPGRLPSSAAAELGRLAPSRIVIVGGEGAIGAGVAAELGRYTSAVERISGGDRYETSALISRSAFPGTSSAVFVASGANFPDALGASAEAARTGVPILLSGPAALSATTADELRRLQPRTVYIAGAAGAISDRVVEGIVSALGTGVTVKRLGGGDRYETAVRVAGNDPSRGMSTVYVASGVGFPDALAAAPAAAALGAPVLLTRPNYVPPSVANLIASANPSRIVITGGNGAVNGDVAVLLGAPADDATRALAGVNALRAAGGRAPLHAMSGLNSVAASWSQEMTRIGGLPHNPNVGSQIPANWRAWGENIAWSSGSAVPPSVFIGLWRDSPPHYANIMNPTFTHVGYGAHSASGRTYATQVFARY